MKCLTCRQKEILGYLENHFSERGYWPSIRNIQEKFGLKSTNGVMGHLKALETKGYISREQGQARAFRIIKPLNSAKDQLMAANILTLPIYGSIAAGYPDYVESGNAVGNLQIDPKSAGIRNRLNSFALKVTGDSMTGAGIYDGDIVVVEREDVGPRNRDIVAALIDGETTLKRYIQNDGPTPYLRAENPNYPDLYPINNLQIQGVAKSVVRSL